MLSFCSCVQRLVQRVGVRDGTTHQVRHCLFDGMRKPVIIYVIWQMPTRQGALLKISVTSKTKVNATLPHIAVSGRMGRVTP